MLSKKIHKQVILCQIFIKRDPKRIFRSIVTPIPIYCDPLLRSKEGFVFASIMLTIRQYWPLFTWHSGNIDPSKERFLVLFSMLRLNLIPQYHGWKTNWHITFKSNISLAYPMGFNKKELWSHPDRPQYYPKAYPIERPVYSIGRGYFGYGWWRTL